MRFADPSESLTWAWSGGTAAGIALPLCDGGGQPRGHLVHRLDLPETEDLTATQPAEHHRFEHGPVTEPAARSQQCVDLGRFHHPGQGSWCANQRHTPLAPSPRPASRQPPRNRIALDITPGRHIRIHRRQRRQPPLDRPRRQKPRLAIRQTDHLAVTQRPLGGDERQHISRRHLDRFLRDQSEEHFQIEPSSQHRVRPTPSRSEHEIVIHHRMTQTNHHPTPRRRRTKQTRNPRHERPPFRPRRGHHPQSHIHHPASKKSAPDYPYILTSRSSLKCRLCVGRLAET